MSKETQRIVTTFSVLFAGSTLVATTLSFVGKRWFTCQSKHEIIVMGLWKYCVTKNKKSQGCYNYEDSLQFQHIVEDLRILRALCFITIIAAVLTFCMSLLRCFQNYKKMIKVISVLLPVCSVMAVAFSICNLFYSSIRARDIVGADVKFKFGWSCVLVWLGAIAAFLTCILNIVLMFIYLDIFRDRSRRMREELNMDNLSITSEALNRITNENDNENELSRRNNDNSVQNNSDIENNHKIETQTSIERNMNIEQSSSLGTTDFSNGNTNVNVRNCTSSENSGFDGS